MSPLRKLRRRIKPVLQGSEAGRARWQRGQAGEDEIKKNKWEGIERAGGEYDSIDDDPDDEDTAEREDEPPTPAELRDFVRQMLAKSQLAHELLLDVLGQHFMLSQT